MVLWTDAERLNIAELWRKVDPDELGPKAVARLLIVYPWNQRYFAVFVNLVDAVTIKASPKVESHGKVVLRGLDIAVNHLDSIKATYAKLGELHSDVLNMDPSNFTLLSDCIIITLAAKFGPSVFTPEVHKAWQKFMNVVVAALGRQYN